MGWISMEPEDTPPMSGTNSICVSTVLLDSGINPMIEPVAEMTLEAPGGLAHVRAECKDGKAERIRVQNLPSFAGEIGARLDVPGLGEIRADTAFGGDSFVVVDAAAVGFDLIEGEAGKLAKLGVAITNAANEQLSFHHPTIPTGAISRSACLGAFDSRGQPLNSPRRRRHPARKDRPLSHWNSGLCSNGLVARGRQDAGRRDFYRTVYHRIGISRTDRGHSHTRGHSRNHPRNHRPRMDYRHPSAYARSR